MQSTQAIVDFLRLVLARARQDGCHQLASSLTLTTLLALVPLLTVMLTLASAFPAFTGLTGQIDDFFASHVLPEQIGKTVLRYVDQFSQRAGRLTLLGLLILAATSFMTMLTIEKAFNRIWRTPYPRPLLQRVVIYWAILTFGPVLIGASLTMTSYLMTASMGIAKNVPMLGLIALWIAPFVLTIIAFTLLYMTVPARRVVPMHAFMGGIVAGILFEVAKRGFAIYVAKVPTYAMVYGTFAAFPIFLIWVYISWLVTLIGATVTASLPDLGMHTRRGDRSAGTDFFEALLVLITLGKALQTGHVLDLDAIGTRIGSPRDYCECLLRSLVKCGWVGKMENGGWALICDPATIKIADVAASYLLDVRHLANDPIFTELEVLMEELGIQIKQSLAMSLLDVIRAEGKPEFLAASKADFDDAKKT